MEPRAALVYVVYTNQFYGTEQMALATAFGLREDFDPVIFIAPSGPASKLARELGLEVLETESARAGGGLGGFRNFDFLTFSRTLRPILSKYERLAFLATHGAHSLSYLAMNATYSRRTAHFQVVHGYDGARHYQVQRLLNPLPVQFVGVSEAVKSELIRHGVRSQKISVIENFLPDDRVKSARRRRQFVEPGIRRAALVGRLVPAKRIGKLLECLEAHPNLNSICFHVYGDGPERERLERRALENQLNVVFEGFRPDVLEQMASADVFIHLRPDEPFGLVILEAMAAGIPVVVPQRGGASSLVTNGVSGLHFDPDDNKSLAAALTSLQGATPTRLNSLVDAGFAALRTRFSERARLKDYVSLINGKLQ